MLDLIVYLFVVGHIVHSLGIFTAITTTALFVGVRVLGVAIP